MKHRPYPKIPLRLEGDVGAKYARWVATEKIHGANFVVGTDGASVRFGKRKAWLEDDEPFFAWQLLRSTLDSAARVLHRRVGARGPIHLYGELYGGEYPHVEVLATPGVSAVQTGIWYCPDIRFALFDVLVQSDVGEVFLAYSKLEEYVDATGLRLAPRILRGSRAEVGALPARFETGVPREWGLPAIVGNFAEGLVLKPDADLAPDDRPVIKMKIPEFSEMRFDESEPWDPAVRLPLKDLCSLADKLVNMARIASAQSKVGSEMDAVIDEIVLDVLVDLETTFSVAMSSLTPAEEETLRMHIAASSLRAMDR